MLQHPNNRIVIPYKTPNIVLTNVYECNNNIITERQIPIIKNLDTVKEIEIPKHINSNDLIKKVQEDKYLKYTEQGIVFYNRSKGIRFKIRNPNYEEIRKLKGNITKLEFLYFNLRKKGEIYKYLKYYPEHIDTFNYYNTKVNVWLYNLWLYYFDCYVKKQKYVRELPFEYRSHVYNLHQKYLGELKNKGMVITKEVVLKYSKELLPQHLMGSINYQLPCRCFSRICSHIFNELTYPVQLYFNSISRWPFEIRFK